MKYRISLFILITFLLSSCAQQKENDVIKNTKDFQYKLNLQFVTKGESPLTKKDFKKFSSLNFFDINENLNVIANFKRTANEEPFEMLTTTSRLAMYVRYGIVSFTIKDKEYNLNIYKSTNNTNTEYKDHLFLPFTDLTNNIDSYAGGRFIDLDLTKISKDQKIVINFNEAYNPYCAYSNRYSCPIPPKENHLDVKINAGVMKYKDSH